MIANLQSILAEIRIKELNDYSTLLIDPGMCLIILLHIEPGK